MLYVKAKKYIYISNISIKQSHMPTCTCTSITNLQGIKIADHLRLDIVYHQPCSRKQNRSRSKKMHA